MARLRVWGFLLLWAVEASAGSSAASRKAASKQGEADDLIGSIVAGRGNPNQVANRISFLGQEGFAARALSSVITREPVMEKRRLEAETLALLGHPEGEPGLLSVLGSEDGATRMAGCRGLGRIKSAKAGPKLSALLDDKTMGVRREAARALGSLRNPKYGRDLLDAAKVEDDPETRAAMLVACGASGDKKTQSGLEGFLTHSSELTRYAAAQALCLMGAPAGMKFAKEKLASADKYERMQGLMLFEGSKAKDAAPMLTVLLEDKDPAIQAATGRILFQGGDAAMLDWLVLKSFQTPGEAKLAYEKELEALRLTDDKRREILRKAGIP